MERLFSFLLADHDSRLALVAAGLCIFACLTTVRVLQSARGTAGPRRAAWLIGAALTGGCAIWVTHFITLVGYTLDMPVGYQLAPLLASLAIAIVVPGFGFAAVLRPEKWAPLVGGAVVGYGAAMSHYVGMTSIALPGRFQWDPGLIALAIVYSVTFATVAMFALRRMRGDSALLVCSVSLIVGLLLLDYAGMAAATVVLDPAIVVEPVPIPSLVMVAAVVVCAAFILAIALIFVVFDRRFAQRRLEEASQLKNLADAAVEGLVVTEAGIVKDVNASFEKLVGRPASEIIGQPMGDLVVPTPGSVPVAQMQGEPADIELYAADGTAIPVEVVARDVGFQGTMRRIYAVRDLRERRAAERRIRHMAYHDPLTGLPNRALFGEVLRDRIDAAERNGESVAVLALDLDRFKQVNDIFGHHAGDALLRTLAGTMSSVLGPKEVIARMGGDEFVIVQSGLPQPESAEDLASRVVAAVCRDIEVEDATFRTATSIGIALFPQDGRDPATLHSNADAALYRAKQEGRATYRFFEPEMDLRLRERRALQAEMREALIRGEFKVYYQPQAETLTGVVSGFEALLRWESRRRGLLSPVEFISASEENGFIVELGEFALRTACAEAASWANPLNISVNLSPVQFQHGDLVALVNNVLVTTGLDPKRLELEVTESVLIRDSSRALAILQGIKALGVCVAMDDFGTGYSSLAYLQTFPFDRIKIDRSFIAELNANRQSEAIIRAIVGLGRGLDVPVTAEGVETVEQQAFLAELDCSEIQGFLIGKPQPIEMMRALVGTAPVPSASKVA